MPFALTVDLGWPWWAVTAIASGVAVTCLAALLVLRSPPARAVAGLLALESAVIAFVAPVVMSDMPSKSMPSPAVDAMAIAAGGRVVHVIEHAPASNMHTVGAVMTFANSIFDGRDLKKMGRDQGFCVRIALANGYECAWTTFLPSGQIAAEGPLSDTERTVGVVIGGAGRYVDAQGWVEEKVHNAAGTEFDVTFHLSR